MTEEEIAEMDELMKEFKKQKGVMFLIGGINLQNMRKGESKKMEVVYNVKYKFKTNERITDEEIKNIFNNKLLKVIMLLEKQALLLKKS